MNHRSLVATVCGALIAIPAFAQDTSPPVPKPVREKKICRSQTVTGSMLSPTICHTKTEWADIDARNQRNADDAMSNRGGRAPSTSGS